MMDFPRVLLCRGALRESGFVTFSGRHGIGSAAAVARVHQRSVGETTMLISAFEVIRDLSFLDLLKSKSAGHHDINSGLSMHA